MHCHSHLRPQCRPQSWYKVGRPRDLLHRQSASRIGWSLDQGCLQYILHLQEEIFTKYIQGADKEPDRRLKWKGTHYKHGRKHFKDVV